MIDINGGEFVLLVVLAVLIFGPEKLPELARKLARVINYLRRIANDAKGQLREQLGPEYADLKLADLNPKSILAASAVGEEVAGVRAEVRAAVADADAAVKAQPTFTPASPEVRFDTEAT